MALLDFLKRKKQAEEAKQEKKSEKKSEEVKVEKEKKALKKEKTEKKLETPKVSVPKPQKKETVFAYEAIKEPHISEKATYSAEKNQYVFKVSSNYNKTEIKKAVQGVYSVDVLSVNIIKIPAKKRRIGKTQGFKKAFSKAVVKIKEGQKIEIL